MKKKPYHERHPWKSAFIEVVLVLVLGFFGLLPAWAVVLLILLAVVLAAWYESRQEESKSKIEMQS